MWGKFQRLSDYFALLAEPRRPWPDLDSLKARFFALSAQLHPDRYHEASAAARESATRDYTELNRAYQCLRDPKERLLHLLELESGRKPAEIRTIADHLMATGTAVGLLCKQVDQFLVRNPPTTAPLLEVQRFQRSQEWTEKIMALQNDIDARRNQAWQQLEQMNEAWAKALEVGSPERPHALPLEALEEQYRLLSYFDRWLSQLQQRVTRLAI